VSSALVIGNGESRRHIDLEIFKQDHILIGCNAIHRDIEVDHLICCDKRMVDEALKNNVKSTIYIREDRLSLFSQLKIVPQLPYQGEEKKDQPEHWNSGPYAVLLSANLGFDDVKLLGFDLYSSNNKVNNIYKDTNNYSKSESKSIDYSFWVYQISKVFEYYPRITFTILNNQNWQMPNQWILPNVKFQPLNG
jgi:hypothetical protein